MLFADVLIVGQLDVDGQSFAPIGLHKTDSASDWLLINGLIYILSDKANELKVLLHLQAEMVIIEQISVNTILSYDFWDSICLIFPATHVKNKKTWLKHC